MNNFRLHKINNVSDNCSAELLIRDLLDKKRDLILIENFMSKEGCEGIVESLKKFNPKYKLALDDGYFFPLPYSTIRTDLEAANTTLSYQNSNLELEQFLLSSSNEILNQTLELLEKKIGLYNLNLDGISQLNKIGFRFLFAGKNGIDIHCENAFINQLDTNFVSKISKQIDFENSISLFITIAAPETGGELIVFNREWDEFKVNVNSTSYEERHDPSGSIFTNRGEIDIESHFINPPVGSLMMFRAAQMWHSINKISGSKDRITFGFFIGKGLDGKLYYWA